MLNNERFQRDMLAAYLEAAAWTDSDELADASAEFSKEATDQASKDCARFIFHNPEALRFSPEQVGHDLWLTRNGHGAGFWDRPEVYDGQANADTFTEYARKIGERYCFTDNAGNISIE